jgi:ribonuclease P protein 3
MNCFRGICKSCKKPLNTINITEEEFQTLQCAFMERVVVGKDVFRNTTPEEVKEFLHFVKMTAPYDMVIDGLNVAFAGGSKKTQSPQSQARTVSMIKMSANLRYVTFMKQQSVVTH